MRRLLPQTLVGQLVTLLAIVLIIAQAVNLALLVGSQRLQERSMAYQSAIEHSVRMISKLPEDLPQKLPYELKAERGGPLGAFFISNVNRAATRDNVKSLTRYNNKFVAQLQNVGITPLQTSVTFSMDGPVLPNGLPKGVVPQGNPKNGFPPPHGPRGRHPEHDGLYRPDLPPSFTPGGVNPQGPLLGQNNPKQIQEILLSAELQEGIWFNAMMPHAATESFTSRILLATGLLLGLALIAAWFFARRISRPISEFARAANRLGRGEGHQLLPESGPSDIRAAAQAFNTMQTRLTRTLETQRNMLRAVGHDLRTPLTSLRIRAEMIPENTGREKFISTLNDMTVMTEEILNWAKDTSGLEEIALVDLETFLSSLVDGYQDEGRDVTLQEFSSRPLSIRRTSIKRALQNLINNALQYGHTANLSVETTKSHVMIHIDDTGLGIPEGSLEEVRQPFARLETSRNKETGGTGLGLSIVETIVQTHGGKLTLSNRKPTGLRATLNLPI